MTNTIAGKIAGKAELTQDLTNDLTNNADSLKSYIVTLLEDKKAENITVISLGDHVPLAKYIIVASGRSVKNVSAIAEYVSSEIHTNTNLNVGLEGMPSSDWALVDCGWFNSY